MKQSVHTCLYDIANDIISHGIISINIQYYDISDVNYCSVQIPTVAIKGLGLEMSVKVDLVSVFASKVILFQ